MTIQGPGVPSPLKKSASPSRDKFLATTLTSKIENLKKYHSQKFQIFAVGALAQTPIFHAYETNVAHVCCSNFFASKSAHFRICCNV